MRHYRFTILVASGLLIASVVASAPRERDSIDDAIRTLRGRYQAELTLAADGSPSSQSPYRLSFAREDSPSVQAYVGSILRGLEIQDGQAKGFVEKGLRSVDPAPLVGNTFKVETGLKVVQLRMERKCRYCKAEEDWAAHRRAVADFFQIYDLEGSGVKSPLTRQTFSGLPFFNLVKERFSNPVFQTRAVDFEKQLEALVVGFAKNPNMDLKTNVLQIALESCGGNRDDAIELAGILLSRDSNVLKYFNYFPTRNGDFIRSVGRSPVLVRLIADLDRSARGAVSDRFSYDGRYAVKNVKNYYYWSAAVVAKELRDLGYSDAEIRELSMQFPRQYKFFRWWENVAAQATNFMTTKKIAKFDRQVYLKDATQVMRMSGEGAQAALRNDCVLEHMRERLRLP